MGVMLVVCYCGSNDVVVSYVTCSVVVMVVVVVVCGGK